LDCSGFVCKVFADIGVDLGNPDYTSAQRIYDNAQDTGDDVQPGDLIFFTRTYAPADTVTHLGIIRAPQPVGQMWDTHIPAGVGLTDYGSDYWQEHYYGHRRIHGLERPPVEGSPWTVEEIAAATGCPAATIAEHWPRILAELQAVGQSSTNTLAVACGTVAIETASTFAPVREAFWMDEAWRAVNLRYYPYYGRGFIQLTWTSNYQAAGDAIGIDLVSVPDRALEPVPAAQVFAWYFAGRDIQTMADAEDWEACRRAVQGGTAGLDRLEQIVTALLA